MNLRLVNDIETIAWDAHAEKILNGQTAEQDIADRKALATAKGLVAVFFMPAEIEEQVKILAEYEIASGAAKRAIHIPLLKGGKPFHDDKIKYIQTLDPSIKVQTGAIRTSAYDGPTFVGAHIVEDECELDMLKPDSEVVLDDDGIESAEPMIIAAQHVADRYGVTRFSCRTALTKQPGMAIAGFSRTLALYSTPYRVWGEGYGFDNNGANRYERLIGVSFTQSPDNFDEVEYTLSKLGGTEGFTVATMDQVVKFNRERIGSGQ